MIKFPKHKASLHLTHNQHKAYYETLEEYLETRADLFTDDCWATTTSKQKALETNELWELQWYPDTPVGFNLIIGSTLEEVLKASNQKPEDK